MKEGDLLECPDGTRLVVDCYRARANMYTAYNATGQWQVLTEDFPCIILSNPRADWPFLGQTTANTHQGIQTVSIPGRQRELVKLVDWVALNNTLYLNPTLRLRLAEVIHVTFRDNFSVAYSVPRTFGTVQHKITRAAKAKEVPVQKTIFDKLLEEANKEDDVL